MGIWVKLYPRVLFYFLFFGLIHSSYVVIIMITPIEHFSSRLTLISGENRETGCLLQRFSVLVQRFNAVLLHDSLPDCDCTDCWTYPTSSIFLYLNIPSGSWLPRVNNNNNNNS